MSCVSWESAIFFSSCIISEMTFIGDLKDVPRLDTMKSPSADIRETDTRFKFSLMLPKNRLARKTCDGNREENRQRHRNKNTSYPRYCANYWVKRVRLLYQCRIHRENIRQPTSSKSRPACLKNCKMLHHSIV